ncbi:Regulator of RpoS [Methylobacterium crusticola]|uniref:Regulator of RpoS n=1 Tax=Methylobacterium crusticola TaxID=1697972 RepID=A0ABQ4QXY7_9HYPH|nr:response regulator [Methylobacterium crusticola]GJD49506.1 Regulator of RpoS [Methylobacterium crusticola]
MPIPEKKTASVLIVEDNYLLLEVLVTLCEQEGLRTHTVSSGEAALTLLRQRGPEIDWLFTDIRLPGLIDGWAVAEAYRLVHPHRPVIYSSTTVNLRRQRVPGSIFVQKPFVIADVVGLARMMARELTVEAT